jgi:2-oxoglutarate ferredoxin oxidoreductase subunit beta
MGSIDEPFNPISLALGAEATFVARTIDMDRPHTAAMLEAVYKHHGAALLEIYQNCNVFNDKAFMQLTGKEERDENRINLEPGKPIVFGPNDEYGIIINLEGAQVVKVADVGIDAIKVHDPADPNPGIAFALSRVSHGPYGPTPIGIFRQVERHSYGDGVRRQLAEAQERKGPGDLQALLASGGTWTVE